MKKKLLATVLLATAALISTPAVAQFSVDVRNPTFTKHGIKCQCTFQDEFATITLLKWTGNSWSSWGGPPTTNGDISYVMDDIILSHGSLYAFTTWAMSECERRAEINASLPLPDPTNRTERFIYALKMLIKVSPNGENIVMPPAPLP